MKKFLNYTLEKKTEEVKQDGRDILFINNPSLDVQLEAVKEVYKELRRDIKIKE